MTMRDFVEQMTQGTLVVIGNRTSWIFGYDDEIPGFMADEEVKVISQTADHVIVKIHGEYCENGIWRA